MDILTSLHGNRIGLGPNNELIMQDPATGQGVVMLDPANPPAEGGGLQIGTTGTTAMAGNKVPTATERGGVLQQTAMADLGAAPTQADFNALLAKLRDSGVLAA